MTSTLTRPPGGPPPTGAPSNDPDSHRETARRASAPPVSLTESRRLGTAVFGSRTVAGRTARTWLGLALGLIPLFMLVGDVRWYVAGVGAMVVTIGPAWGLRLWQPTHPARVWQLLPGLILLPIYLTAALVPTGAYGGFIPSSETWTQLGLLHDQLVQTIAKSAAPIESTPGVTLALAVLLGLGAIMVDILCVVLEAPAMVGFVLAPIYVLSGATVREPVAWWMFVLAAIGYLLMLSTTGRSSKPWGREIGRRPYGAPASLVSGKRIGAIAVVIGTVLPLAAFGASHNVISDATHGGSGGGGGTGDGTGGVAALAALKGTLTLGDPIDLMNVRVPTSVKTEPFYLRQTVLDTFTGSGWVPAPAGSTRDVQGANLPYGPALPNVNRTTFSADIAVSGLDGRRVTFADTQGVTGLPGDSQWDPARGTFARSEVDKGDRYTVNVAQPDPTEAQLNTSNFDNLSASLPAVDRVRPTDVNQSVVDQTNAIKAKALAAGAANNPYQVAKAIATYFTDPDNGFVYTLAVNTGDSTDDLANFLETKQGYCQQYAAAMGVMLRLSGVPSRVVVGYTHVKPDSNGAFTVTTRDAHAWVEAYLGGVGWTAFDPTPLAATESERQVPLPWMADDSNSTTDTSSDPAAPKTTGSASNSVVPGGLGSGTTPTTSSATGGGSIGTTGTVLIGIGVALVIVLAIGAIPAFQRRRLRRARLRTGGADATESHLLELRDDCVDLGLPWSPARSPRQIGAWLAELGVPDAASGPLLRAVERGRYGRVPDHAPDVDALTASLRQIEAALRTGSDRGIRWRARWWPRSVTTRLRAAARQRVATVRSTLGRWSGGGPRRVVRGQ